MNIQFSYFLTAILVLPLSFPVFAEKTLPSETIEEEIIVTATRYSQLLKSTLPTAHVITSIDIERMQPRDLPSLLGSISGVDFNDSGGRGSTTGVFVRGTASSQIIVLIDGVRSSSATTGATALGNLPLGSIDRVEVVKGPLSGLYGADALGGAIQVFTKKGKSSNLEASLSTSYASHNTQDYDATFSGGNNQHQFLTSFSKESTDGIDRTDLKTGGNEDDDNFEEKSGNLSASFTLSKNLQAQLNYLRSEGRSEFDNTFGVDLGRFSENELETAGTRLLYHPDDSVNISLNLGYLSDHSIIPVFTSDIQTRRNSASLLGDVQVNTEHRLIVGLDYYNEDVTTLAAFPETERDNKGYFVQWQADLESMKMVSSLRYDDNEAYGYETNGSMALSFTLSDSLELTGSYGTAFKAPSFNDLYFPSFGNPNILPEESESFEVTLRGSYGAADWRVSAYQNKVDNLIGFDLSTFTANNTTSAVLEGVELEIDMAFNEWRLSANIDYMEARDDSTNEWLDDRAIVAANLRVDRRFDRWYLGIDAIMEHGRHDQGGTSLSGFSIWGISAIFDVNENLKISGRVNNLFDKDYTVNLASSSIAYETEGTIVKVSIEYTL